MPKSEQQVQDGGDANHCGTPSVEDAEGTVKAGAPTEAEPAIEWKPWPSPHPRSGKKRVLERRRELPYGIWSCSDGTRVLFNRDYQPVWQRTADGVVTRVEIPAEGRFWVSWDEQHWFYKDHNPPWRDKRTLHFLERVLEEFGVRQGGKR